MDRTQACGACNVGSIPTESTTSANLAYESTGLSEKKGYAMLRNSPENTKRPRFARSFIFIRHLSLFVLYP